MLLRLRVALDAKCGNYSKIPPGRPLEVKNHSTIKTSFCQFQMDFLLFYIAQDKER